MVGETTQRRYPANIEELIAEYNRNRLNAKERKQKIAEAMLAMEKEYAAIEKEELVWEVALDTVRNMGKQTGPKRRTATGRKTQGRNQEHEEVGEELEAY